MIQYCCSNCRLNNTVQKASVTACVRCGEVFFMDGDVQLASHEWTVECYRAKSGWANRLSREIEVDGFKAFRPESFETIKAAYAWISSQFHRKKFEKHRIVNIRSGRVVGPVNFDLVAIYTPDMDPVVAEVIPTITKPVKKRRVRRKLAAV